MKEKNETNKKLNSLFNELEKKYSVQKASDMITDKKIRTGVYALDYVLDGGISQAEGGHKIEFYGGESSGKTTLSLHVIREYQKLGKTCVFINAENSYDSLWAEIIGIDNSNLIVVKPSSLEEAGNLLIELIPKVDLIVIDSITALVPEEEIEKDLTEKTMASQAKVNSPMCRKINKTIANYKTTIIFINQLREKVGIMYGNPETTSGGRSLRHLYDTRLQFRLGKPIDIGTGDNKERIGTEINLFGQKNKKGTPCKKAVVDFYFTGEIDNNKTLFFSGIKAGVIKLEGKTYTFEDKKAVGQDAFKALLTDKDWKKIEELIWKNKK